ncbi:MAG: DUF4340 domain-containing protein [bacterium]|nr:DUF4340 domain-containing protein [bacterium]
MNAKTLILMLLGIALLWGVSRMPGPDDSAQAPELDKGPHLFPALQEKVNDVHGLELRVSDGSFHFTRNSEGLWTLKERGDYPADRKKLDGLVLAAARSKCLEQKTKRPDRYAALGLSTEATGTGDEAVPPAGAMKVTDKDGETLASLWVGKRRGRSATEAYFVRKQDDDVCWAASGNLALDPNIVAWLDSTLVDIPSADIQAVRITHPDGEQVLLERPDGATQNTPLSILKIPDGKERQSEWVTSRFESAMQGFKMQDVRPASQVEVPEGQTTRSEFCTKDRLVIALTTWEVESSIFATIEADYSDGGSVLNWSPAKARGQFPFNPSTAQPAGLLPPLAPDGGGVFAEIERLNQRFSGWVYELPSWKGAALRGRMEELVKAKDDATDPFGDAAPTLPTGEPEQIMTVKPEQSPPVEKPKPDPDAKTTDPVFEIDPEAVKKQKKGKEDLVSDPD